MLSYLPSHVTHISPGRDCIVSAKMLPLLGILLIVRLTWGAHTDPHCDGKQVMVHLFEWKWTDVANECERFLSQKGFCGVQVSPVNEHVMVTKEYARPWWERYQPVSYKLTSRSGNEQQFKDMVQRCKKVGVRIYVDSVVNHMAGLGRTGTGTAGSKFNSDAYDFPGVPYRREHFNSRSKCPSGDGNVNNYGDPNNVRNCNLVGLTDLDQSIEYVRDKIAGFYDHLIDLGVAGFRIDAAKHMWPADIKAIQERIKDLPEGGKAFFFHEVIDQNDGAIKVNEYYDLGYVTEFRYCQKIAYGTHDFGQLGGVVDYGWGMAESSHAFVFVDNHDNQRGHGGGGNLITHKTPRDYKMAQAFTLAYNYGFVRVMSSYFFGSDTDAGPPHNADFSAKDVTINADGSCGNGWVCEHRWDPIANMVAFRNVVAGTGIEHWYDSGDVVAFARGNKGFFVMAKQGHLDQTFQTGLPAGDYCDLVHNCQLKITVDGSGNAHILIDNNDEPIAAFIVGGANGPTHGNGVTHGSNVGGNTGTSPGVTSGPVITDSPTTAAPLVTPDNNTGSWKRTIILVQRRTNPGQDVFLRGGIDHSHVNGCSSDVSTSPCAIPIRHTKLGSSIHFASYNAWSKGDNYLDWFGREPGQGAYNGRAAEGTPAVWTTNNPNKGEYNKYNTYGEHYWLVDVDMDCSKTVNSFFEVKAEVNGAWEGIMYGDKCSGAGAIDPPYQSQNHMGRCGYVNVFHWDTNTCEILPA
ncbi:alpha-amylase-like [Haliotis cracherodii]|uniref:alpha-amylase-like n=1 Tax=Haliotis cracherodii TaxID=6455 RepID=UPI0039EBD31D